MDKLNKNIKREELVKELNKLQEQERNLHKQIDAIDYNENYNKAKEYKGRYYKQIQKEYDSEYICCVFVFGIDEESCVLESISVSYWKNNFDHFGIEYLYHFNPDKDDFDKWEEIKEIEFDRHYDEVMKRVESILNKKKITYQDIF